MPAKVNADTETHADIACRIAIAAGPGVFAKGARDAVIHNDFTTLERMFPGMIFAAHKVGPDEWQLLGTCTDGSTAIWEVGG